MEPIKALLFTSSTCIPCGVVKAYLNELETEEGYPVDVVAQESLDNRFIDFRIRSVPTLVDLESDKRFVGAEAILAHLKTKYK